MPDAATQVVSVALPLALAFIMLYLGTTLQLADFAAVLRRPRALAIGLAGQMLLVPALGFATAAVSGLDPMLKVGIVLLAACPGGVSSGLLTHLARGDVALSIVLTAVSSAAAALSLPFVVGLALHVFAATELATALPLGATVLRIFLLTTVPVLLGMALRHGLPRLVARVEPITARVSTGLFVLIVLATFWTQRQVILANLAHVGLVCALLNLIVMGGAWAAASGAGLQDRDRTAVTMECGLQNSALGIYVTLELLRQPVMSIPSVVYALLMNAGAIALVVGLRRRIQPARR